MPAIAKSSKFVTSKWCLPQLNTHLIVYTNIRQFLREEIGKYTMGLYRGEYAEMKMNVTTKVLLTKMMMARTMMMKINFILRAGNA